MSTNRYAWLAAAQVLVLSTLFGCNGHDSRHDAAHKTMTPASKEVQLALKAPEAAPKTFPEPFPTAYQCLSSCSSMKTDRSSPPSPKAFGDLLRSSDPALINFTALLNKLPEDLRPNDASKLLNNTEKPLKTGSVIAIQNEGVQYQIYSPVNFQAAGSDRTPDGYTTRNNYLYGGLTVLVRESDLAMSLVYSEGGNLRIVKGDAPAGIALAYEVMKEVFVERQYNDDRRLTSENELKLPMNNEVILLAKRRMLEIAKRFDEKSQSVAGVARFSLKTALPKRDESKSWWSANRSSSDCIQSDGPAGRLDSLSRASGVHTSESRDRSGNLSKVEVIVPLDGSTEEVWTYYKSKEICVFEKVNNGRRLADKYR